MPDLSTIALVYIGVAITSLPSMACLVNARNGVTSRIGAASVVCALIWPVFVIAQIIAFYALPFKKKDDN